MILAVVLVVWLALILVAQLAGCVPLMGED